MSHFSTIKTQLKEAEPLIKALNNLGYIINQEEKFVKGYRGKFTAVDISMNLPGDTKVGFKWDNNSNAYELVTDLDLWKFEIPVERFIEFEKNYWKNSTAIGFIFSLGALMGFVVGCVVVYQILYSDVTDHLPEYATLLAMGYRLKSLFFVVAREGFLLALFGYLPAYFSGQILYSVIRSSTKLPIIMDTDKTILIFVLVLVMCMGSAAVAMRKLVDADPAEIF